METTETGEIKIYCETTGATIHYSGCGISGTCSSGDSLTIIQSGTMTAYATKSGYANSNNASVDIQLMEKLPVPEISASGLILFSNWSVYPEGTRIDCVLSTGTSYEDCIVNDGGYLTTRDGTMISMWMQTGSVTVTVSCEGYSSSSTTVTVENG